MIPNAVSSKLLLIAPTLVAFIVVASFLSILLESGFREIFSITVGFSALCFVLLIFKMPSYITIPSSLQSIGTIYGVVVFSMVTILLVKPMEAALYVQWTTISLPSFLRLVSSILITSFFPGYLLLNILEKKYLSTAERITISYLTSLFLTSLVGFVSMLLGQIEEASIMLLLLNGGLLFISAILTYRKRTHSYSVKSRALSRMELASFLLFISTCVIVLASVTIVISNAYPLLRGDQWFLNGFSLQIEKKFPVASNGQVMPGYPWWFGVFVVVFTQLSGLPPVNSFVSLFTLAVMPLVALLATFKRLFGMSSKIPSIAVLMQTFAGYGWIMFLVTRPNNDVYLAIKAAGKYTYDLWVQNGAFPLIISPTYLVGLVGLATLLLFILDETFGYSDILVFGIIFAETYLGHIAEAVFIVLFALVITSLSKISRKKITIILNSFLAGLMLVGLVDVFSPGRYYTIGLVYVGTLVAVLTIEVAYFTAMKLNRKRLRILRLLKKLARKEKFRTIVAIVIVLFYAIDINLTRQNYGNVHFGITYPDVPLYFYPIRLGIMGTFALLCLIYLLYKDFIPKMHKQTFWKIVLFGIVGFFAVKGAQFILPNSWPEYRFTLIWIPLSVLAAYFIVKLSHWAIKRSKRFAHMLAKHLAVGVFVGATLSAGLASSLLAVEFYSTPRHPTQLGQADLEALNYVKNNVHPNVSIITPSIESQNQLHSFGGVSMLQVWERWNDPLKSAINPFTVFSILHESHAEYVYVRNEDYKIDSKPSFFYDVFLNELPVVFKNMAVTIFYIPKFYPPTSSNLTILLPPFNRTTIPDVQAAYSKYYLPIMLLASSGYKYSISQKTEEIYPKNTAVILPFDPSTQEPYIDYLVNGGHILVLGNNEGCFRRILSLVSRGRCSVNIASFSERQIQLSNATVELLDTIDNQTIPIGEYKQEDDAITPILFSKYVGEGTITYVNFPCNMLQMNGEKRRFNESSALFKLLILPIDGYVSRIDRTYYDSCDGIIQSKGTVRIDGTSIYIPSYAGIKTIGLESRNRTIARIETRGSAEFHIASQNSCTTIIPWFSTQLLFEDQNFDVSREECWQLSRHGLEANVSFMTNPEGLTIKTVANEILDSWITLQTNYINVSTTRYPSLGIRASGTGIVSIWGSTGSEEPEITIGHLEINGETTEIFDLEKIFGHSNQVKRLQLFYWSKYSKAGSVVLPAIVFSSRFFTVPDAVGISEYIPIKLSNDSRFEITANANSYVELFFENSDVENMKITNGTIKFNGSIIDRANGSTELEPCLFVKEPIFHVNGKTVFNNSFIHKKPHVWESFGAPLIVDQQHEFSVVGADQDFIMINATFIFESTFLERVEDAITSCPSHFIVAIAVISLAVMLAANKLKNKYSNVNELMHASGMLSLVRILGALKLSMWWGRKSRKCQVSNLLLCSSLSAKSARMEQMDTNIPRMPHDPMVRACETCNLGCGADNWGTVRVDINKRYLGKKNTLNILADVQCLPFRSHAFKEARANHVLEHLPNWKQALNEWTRVSEELDITIPKDTYFIRAFLFELTNLIFPFSKHMLNFPARRREHMWAITPRNVISLLRRKGYQIREIKINPYKCFRPITKISKRLDNFCPKVEYEYQIIAGRCSLRLEG